MPKPKKPKSSIASKIIAVDCETTGLNLRHKCRPFIVSTCTSSGNVKSWCWPVDPLTRQPSIPPQERKQVRDYLEGAILVFHHAKYDIRALSTIGIGFDFWEDDWGVQPEKNPKYPPIIVRCPTFHDTLLMSHACCSSDLHGLKELGVKYLRYSDSDERALAAAVGAATRYCKSNDIEVSLGFELNGKRSTKSDYWLPKFVYDYILETEGEVPEEFEHFKDVCVNYAGKDVERTILLHGVFQEVMDDLDVRKGYEREKRLLQVIYRTEQDGITLSERKRVAKVKALTKAKDEHALVAQKFADKISKKKVNLRSSPDLIDVIYKKLKMPITKATPKTGQPSTKAEIFADFYDLTKDPKGGHYNRAASAFFLNLILAKKNEKAAKDLENYKSYSLPCPNHKDYIVIYPSLNQSGTSTVRFSCSNPNGQNVCLHPDTELLTNKGWVKVSKLEDGQLVAQYWPESSNIDFVKPTAVHSPHYKGNLLNISTELHIDFTVTPNHRCLTVDRKTGKQKVSEARNFPKDAKLPQAGIYAGGDVVLSEAEITLLCAMQADGSYHKLGGLKFCFKKPRKIKRLKACLKTLNIDCTFKKHKDITSVYISKQSEVYKLCKKWLPEKKFNELFLSLSRNNLNQICEELFFWDGDYTRKAVYSSSDIENADWAQIFFSLSGHRAHLVTRTPNNAWAVRDHHYVNVTKNQNYSLTTNRKVKEVQHEEKVYCVTVPSEFIVIRHNGIVSVTGNSKVSLVEIGKDKEEFPGPKIRDVYSPPPGKIWYAIDYNQLELRVFAADSEEHSLIQALDDGYDFHGFVSTQIFNKPIEKISKQERRIAKNTDFAIIFGAGEAKVNETAGIPGAYKMFAGLFPNVHTHMQKVIAEVRRDGFVRTMDGYRLAIPNEPYKAVNYRAQGTAGSIIKNAMIAIDQEGLVDWIDSRIVLQIHDELIIEFTKDSPKHTPAAVYAIMKAMEQAGNELGINTPVSCERIETDWGHGEEVKVTKTRITPIKKAA